MANEYRIGAQFHPEDTPIMTWTVERKKPGSSRWSVVLGGLSHDEARYYLNNPEEAESYSQYLTIGGVALTLVLIIVLTFMS